MTPPIFRGNLPSTYYSLKVTSNIDCTIIMLYIISIGVIVTYHGLLLCRRCRFIM